MGRVPTARRGLLVRRIRRAMLRLVVAVPIAVLATAPAAVPGMPVCV
jgi:hypothetical protein